MSSIARHSLIAGLVYFCSSVAAAPPLSALSNAAHQGQLFQSQNHSTPAGNARSLSDLLFPPGTQPPQDPWFYDIPHSEPQLTIKFRDFTHDPHRSETSVHDVFRQAFVEASGPGRRDMRLRQPETENSGSIYLIVEPQRPHYLLPFTYGCWLHTLRGLFSFARAYPGLDFSFELYGYEERVPDREFYLAYGSLVDEH